MPTHDDSIQDDSVKILPDGRRMFRGVILKKGDIVCRCGVNVHKSSETKTAFEIEQELALKMSKQLLKQIDDDIIEMISKGHKP